MRQRPTIREHLLRGNAASHPDCRATAMTSHSVLGDKVRVYRRANSSLWQCSTYLYGKEWRVSSKTDSLALAKEFAEDWYLELRGKSRIGQLKMERTFADSAG
ncbi:hypothetical protein [Agrobacterium cavarae]|uniref:hypothetical protein n=2 Tax=Agrobacterium cavarae TaxID=2528239 RepID=UPI0028B08CCF|nr:hypothetical protein [Agrobacterium cavarae]